MGGRVNGSVNDRKKNFSEADGNAASEHRKTRRTECSAGSSVNGAERNPVGTSQKPSGGVRRPQSGAQGATSRPQEGAPGPLNGGQAPNKQAHRRGSVILLRILTAVGGALALIAVIRLLLLFVPIKEIVVPEDSFYTAEELCETAELSLGKRLFGFSKSRVKNALTEEYPLLSDVKIKRTLGGTLTVIPEEHAADFYVNVSGTYCVLARADFRVLIETDDRERLAQHGLYEISLPDVRVAFLGEPLEFGEEKSNMYIETLLEALDASELSERITGIRAAERFDLSVIVDGKYDITLGSVSELERKLDYFIYMETSGATGIFESGSHAEVDLSDLTSPTIRAVDEIDATVSG